MNPPPTSTRQVLLGIFIVGQLFFLVSSNLIGYLKDNRTGMSSQAIEAAAPGWPEEKGHLWHLMEHLAKTDRIWAQATGQFQTWCLFAPTISRECVFPAVELRWDEEPTSASALARPLSVLAANDPLAAACLGQALHAAKRMPPAPELVLSDNEPADREHYARSGAFRIRRFENNLVIVLRPDEEETAEQTSERWSDRIHSHVADYSEILRGYLRWRTRKALSQWPGREQPRQVILVLRRYHINDREKAPPFWHGPYSVPVARWQPAGCLDSRHQPLEWYDPISQQFKGLRK